MAIEIRPGLKNDKFSHIYFLNMDISLIIIVTCSKLSTHDARTHSEGSVSQNFDLGFSFCFIV